MIKIKIFNSMNRQKEIFKPLISEKVNMYVCGVTVYDDSHIGHARSAIVFDMIARYFRFRGFEVTLVKNFTDVDDKIIKRSHEENIPWKNLTEKYIDEYHNDMDRLNVTRPTHEPKATEYISDMIKIIQRLMEKGYAYESAGDVYYRVNAFKSYGQLSRRDLSIESAGIRVDVNELKENPLDFVLWKSSKPGEPSWDSPWGKGRPGWHIECSAMAMSLLGETIDIHGGGEDLLFPHHENEIAQSEGFSGKKFVGYWIHNGFVTVNQEKMSKSLGNFFTIKEIFNKYSYPVNITGEILRYFILSTHYRQPIQFSDQAIDEAKSSLDRFYDLLKRCKEASGEKKDGGIDLNQALNKTRTRFIDVMDDDFNTPEGIAHLHLLRSELNKHFSHGIDAEEGRKVLSFFAEVGKPLGLFHVSPEQWPFFVPIPEVSSPFSSQRKQNTISGTSTFKPVLVPEDEAIKKLIMERAEAKNKKDFKKADEIRKDLLKEGVILEDHPGGKTTWKK